MKRFFLPFIIVAVALAGYAFAADPAAPAVPAASVGFLDWFKQNTGPVLAVALAISELLSLIPAFRGNGILDTILKALHALSDKQTTPPA